MNAYTWTYMCVFASLIKGAHFETVTLTSKQNNVTEHDNFTLTCTTTTTTSSRWFFSRYQESIMSAIGWNGNTCSVTGYINNPYLYGINCNSSHVFELTIFNVTNDLHNEYWNCRVGSDISASIYMTVIVPVKYVNMSVNNREAKGVLDCVENETLSFECITSFGRPQPNITWYTGYSYDNASDELPTKSKQLSDDAYNYTRSSVTFPVTRSYNQKWIFCSSSNLKDVPPVFSDYSELNVQYPPVLGEVKNVSVIEMKLVNLACPVTLGNPTETQFTWTRNADGNVVQNETFLVEHVLRKDKGFYTFMARNTMKLSNGTYVQGNNTSTLYLEVLYPPEGFHVTCMSGSLLNESVSDTISVIEGNSLTLICSAKGNPYPSSYYWSGKIAANTENLTFNVNQNHSGDYICTAENTMIEIPGNTTTGANNKTYKLEVLFPPEILEVQNITITEGKPVVFKYRVKPGNPQVMHFSWTRTVDNQMWENESFSIPSVRRNDESEYTLSVSNRLKPTCGAEGIGNKSKVLSLEVLYPPEGMRVACVTDSSLNEAVVDVFNITEGTNLTLACSAISKPSPSSYFWSGKMNASQANLTFYVTRNHSGDYSCTASNSMKEIPGTTTNGTVSKQYSISVLYAPEVQKMQNITAIEGENFTIDCPVIFGYPSDTTFRWLRMNDNSVWNSQTLSMNNITRYDGNTYTCEVNNTLNPTYGIKKIGLHSQNVNIEILYKADITGFAIEGHNTYNNVTVNESDTVRFKCNVDSNPGSFMKITLEEKSLEEKNGTKELKHLIDKTKCTDWGTYYCHAHNQYNIQQNIPRTYITMYVNCAPRQWSTIYPANNVTNVTSGQHVSKTLTFKALAYPTPVVKWEKKENSSWIELRPDSSNKTLISSSAQDLQYNLTVFNIFESDYGQYRLNITNRFGRHIQLFNLIPNDKPNAPKQFRAYDHNITETSVSLWWEPGFDGGLPQTFIIGVREETVSEKNYTVNNTDAPIMNVTLTCLKSGTQYYFCIYASNQLGSTRFPEEITVRTKAAAVMKAENIVGAAAGGTIGGVLVIALIALALLYVRKRRMEMSQEDKQSHEYQNMNVIKDGDMSSLNDGFANVYEKLQNTGSNSDQRYQQLSSFVREGNTGQFKVYENLRLTKKSEELDVENSSGQLETVLSNKHIQTIV